MSNILKIAPFEYLQPMKWPYNDSLGKGKKNVTFSALVGGGLLGEGVGPRS